MNKTIACKVIKVVEDKSYECDELLVCEYSLTIFLNKKKLATLLCSPEKLRELTLGFLRTERLITSLDDITNFDLDEEKGIVEVETINKDTSRESFYSKKVDLESIKSTSSKVPGAQNFLNEVNCEPVVSDVRLDVNKIYDFMTKDLDYSEVFKTTGGVHCVALCDAVEIRVIAEDVARHNALDKVIGEALINDIYLKDKIIILSGRVSLEMILKAAKLQIPVIISKSAPTSLSVSLAKKVNITLVGFVRGNKMNIYSNGERINL
ncbi:formate dehydrogenase accessory sulfurtransferase FdhD [Clostridium lacusfryxellense]|uniref:formate dehydrogenase accessory sulfurtransferase FdhD n=1 Tax=Clostridium lacusfryxellense TaxID=205328 RepID=UPI001C0B0597|nr:formate dehydrogenase accessory sulfurtransferase FdhD [Clostridium lacusfryxellense]MBU3109971.1 formate dehydrogenase accessory sulfurtransferase FdhD [Clostridium lacusfryxellense]